MRIVVFGYPGQEPNPALMGWLFARAREGAAVRRADWCYGVAEGRNGEVRRFLDDGAGSEWLLTVDADMVPDPADGILAGDDPVAFYGYTGSAEQKTGHVDSLGCGFLRIHRSVLAAMPPPWFATESTPDGTGRVACECDWFGRKLAKLSIEPRQVGIAGHLRTMVAWPQGNSVELKTPSWET